MLKKQSEYKIRINIIYHKIKRNCRMRKEILTVASNLVFSPIQMKKIKAKIIVVMGVSGSGKTTLGNVLSEQLHFPFIEGDIPALKDIQTVILLGSIFFISQATCFFALEKGDA